MCVLMWIKNRNSRQHENECRRYNVASCTPVSLFIISLTYVLYLIHICLDVKGEMRTRAYFTYLQFNAIYLGSVYNSCICLRHCLYLSPRLAAGLEDADGFTYLGSVVNKFKQNADTHWLQNHGSETPIPSTHYTILVENSRPEILNYNYTKCQYDLYWPVGQKL
jgi:hypothetical protein